MVRNIFDFSCIIFCDRYSKLDLHNRETAKAYTPGCTSFSLSQLSTTAETVYTDTNQMVSALDSGIKRWKTIYLDYYPEGSQSLPSYDYVAVGGSFDHMHNGHRKLLYTSTVVCQKQLTVGVTADFMLTSKSMADMIEKFPIRCARAKEFLSEVTVGKDVDLNVVEISDPFGPTIVNPLIQAIVVSSETVTGAFKINEIRLSKSMSPLDILVISRGDAALLSSTFLRKALSST
jgi:phosphopantetheine adenylyltransferase